MKWKLCDALDNLDEQELYKLQDDLSSGSAYIKKMVSERIKKIEKEKTGICVTCGNNLADYPRSYTLIFGPDGFRKKAGFCELDCLEYFLVRLKSMKVNNDELQARNQDV